jgi:hypothetical protein
MSKPDWENQGDVLETSAELQSSAINTNSSKPVCLTPFEQRKREWWEWHKANPDVWKYFERFSMEAVSKGRKKISHWLIINRIRWEVNIVTTGEDFKISNDYIAFYARLWKAKHPEHKDLFTTKRMIGEKDD